MGFITSLIVISFCAFWSYYLYHNYGLPKGHKAFVAWYAIVIVGSLMILDTLIYIGVLDFIFPYLNRIPWVNIDSGRDFMWNSFQFFGIDWGIDYKNDGLNWIAIVLILSYPMWFKWFSNGSRMLFGGNNPHQRGMWYLFEPTRKPKPEEKIAKQPQKT
ncbi:MAG: hypothetical protein ACTSQJ_04330 [Promethearchaeota archaeon]